MDDVGLSGSALTHGGQSFLDHRDVRIKVTYPRVPKVAAGRTDNCVCKHTDNTSGRD